MLVSSTSMKAAMATTTPITQMLAWGRQGSGAKGCDTLWPEGISGRELAGPSVFSGMFSHVLLEVCEIHRFRIENARLQLLWGQGKPRPYKTCKIRIVIMCWVHQTAHGNGSSMTSST